MAYSVVNNTPVAGAIQWAGMNIQYLGETYAIQDGYTNTLYAYWTIQYPNNLVVTNTFPVLGSDDCLIFVNKNGTAVVIPNSTVISGDIIIPGTILAGALATNCVTADKLAAGAVTANSLAAGAVTANSLAAGSVTAQAVAADAIGAGAISADAITGDVIVAGAIATRHIASAAVTANEIAAGAITTDKLKAESVDANKIKAGSITTNHLSPLFGEQLVIGANPALTEITDSVVAEANRAIAVEGELKNFTDKANAFFVFDIALGMMTIGKTGSPFTSEFSTTKLSFKQSGAEVAYISNNKLYISIAQVMDILTIGSAAEGYVDMDTKADGLRASWRAS